MKSLNAAIEKAREGFSLVELTVAMFVISIGLLGVFTLFPSAMRAAKNSQEDTVSHMFAETAFSTLRAAAHSASDADWQSFKTTTQPMSTLGWQNVDFSGGSGIGDTGGDYVTVTFTSQPSGTSGVINHIIRYRLSITEKDDDPASYSRFCTLEVIGTGTGGEPVTFYTEIFKFKMTP